MNNTKSSNPFEGAALTSILVVSDIARSRTFYIDKLGAEFYREYGGTSLVMTFLGHWFLLVTGGGPSADKPDIHFVDDTDPNRVDHAFTIRVKDCTQSYKLLQERGISFITPPYNRGQETRCFFRDPDGHLFEISEVRGS